MGLPRNDQKQPIAAVGVVVLKGDRVLLVQRGQAPKQGIWTLPGGAIELGETAQQAARREILEECNVHILVRQVLDVVDLIERDERGRVRYHYTVIEFLAHHLKGDLKAASDARRARWVALEELETLDLSSDVVRLISRAFAP